MVTLPGARDEGSVETLWSVQAAGLRNYKKEGCFQVLTREAFKGRLFSKGLEQCRRYAIFSITQPENKNLYLFLPVCSSGESCKGPRGVLPTGAGAPDRLVDRREGSTASLQINRFLPHVYGFLFMKTLDRNWRYLHVSGMDVFIRITKVALSTKCQTKKSQPC